MNSRSGSTLVRKKVQREVNKNYETACGPKRFATLSNEEMDNILEEKNSVKTKQTTTGQWQHLKVGLSHRVFKIHADGSNNKM